MGKWYGNISNRVDENKMYCKEIEVGTYATEYMWSDRHAYEVVEVIDQNHVFIRRLKSIRTDNYGMSDAQSYRYESDLSRPVEEIKKTKSGWHRVNTYSVEKVKETANRYQKYLNEEHALGKYTKTEIAEFIKWIKRAEKGKEVKELASKINISFGVADEYYDYSF